LVPPHLCHQNTQCGNCLDVDEDIIDELLKFSHNVIYGGNKSSSMAEACADKWNAMKKKSFLRIPPDADCLRQHFIHANYSTYLVLHPLLKKHSSPIGHGYCRPVRHTRPALPAHLPTLCLETAEKSEEDEHEETDEEQEEGREEDSELSEEEWSDLN